jgi:hypothetical protein
MEFQMKTILRSAVILTLLFLCRPASAFQWHLPGQSDFTKAVTKVTPVRSNITVIQIRTPPDGRSNPTVTRNQTTNGRMFFAKSAPDLMQRLPCLPTTPHVEFLLRRKPKPSPLSHKHHL